MNSYVGVIASPRTCNSCSNTSELCGYITAIFGVRRDDSDSARQTAVDHVHASERLTCQRTMGEGIPQSYRHERVHAAGGRRRHPFELSGLSWRFRTLRHRELPTNGTGKPRKRTWCHVMVGVK